MKQEILDNCSWCNDELPYEMFELIFGELICPNCIDSEYVIKLLIKQIVNLNKRVELLERGGI